MMRIYHQKSFKFNRPPRNMGENSFEILNAREIWLKYYQDKPGK